MHCSCRKSSSLACGGWLSLPASTRAGHTAQHDTHACARLVAAAACRIKDASALGLGTSARTASANPHSSWIILGVSKYAHCQNPQSTPCQGGGGQGRQAGPLLHITCHVGTCSSLSDTYTAARDRITDSGVTYTHAGVCDAGEQLAARLCQLTADSW